MQLQWIGKWMLIVMLFQVVLKSIIAVFIRYIYPVYELVKSLVQYLIYMLLVYLKK